MRISRVQKGYYDLEDGDILEAGDLAFGNLSSGKYGWGRIPSYLIGQALCIGAVGLGHPTLVIRKQTTEKTDGNTSNNK